MRRASDAIKARALGAQMFLLAPNDASAVEGVAVVLVFIYTLGLIRAWELLGIEQVSVRRWLQSPPAACSPSSEKRRA